MNDASAWKVSLLMCLLYLALSFIGGSITLDNFRFENTYDIFFDRDDEVLIRNSQIESEFVKQDTAYITITPPDKNVFSRKSAQAIAEIEDSFWSLNDVYRVDGISNYQKTSVDGDDLVVSGLLQELDAKDHDYLLAAREYAINHENINSIFINNDGSVSGALIYYNLQDAHDSHDKVNDKVGESVSMLMSHVQSMSEKYPAYKIHVSGYLPINNAFGKISESDNLFLTPITLLVIFLVLIFHFRSFKPAFAIILSVQAAVLITNGIMFSLGYTLNSILVLAPVMIMTLAIADCIHITNSFIDAQTKFSSDAFPALKAALRSNLTPVVATSITTFLGFISLNFSDSPPFRALGNIVSIGVIVAMVASLTLLPAILLLLRVKSSHSQKNLKLAIIYGFSVRHRSLIVIAFVLAGILSLAYCFQNRLHDVMHEYFDPSLSVRQQQDYITKNMTGLSKITYRIPAIEDGGINEPEYLEHLEKLGAFIRDLDGVVHVSSYIPVIKEINMNMNGGDGGYYRIPQSRELASQYLLMYELSLTYGRSINDLINNSKSATKINVVLKNTSNEQLVAVMNMIDAHMINEMPEYMRAKPAAPSAMFALVASKNAKSMLVGSALVLVLTSLAVLIFLHSVKLSLISFAPTLLPAIFSFGVWGASVKNISLGLSMVISITLGIVVDFSIHYLIRYKRYFDGGSSDPGRDAFNSVASSIWCTAIVLGAGFSVLMLSDFTINAQLGIMTSMTVFFASVTCLVLLPAILDCIASPGNRIETRF